MRKSAEKIEQKIKDGGYSSLNAAIAGIKRSKLAPKDKARLTELCRKQYPNDWVLDVQTGGAVYPVAPNPPIGNPPSHPASAAVRSAVMVHRLAMRYMARLGEIVAGMTSAELHEYADQIKKSRVTDVSHSDYSGGQFEKGKEDD